MFVGSRHTLLTRRRRQMSARDLVTKYSATSAIILDDFDIAHTWGGSALLFQDSGGTTPVAADGDRVGKAISRDATGNHVTRAMSGSRGTWNQASGLPPYLSFDGLDDRLHSAVNAATSGMIAAFGRGTAATTVMFGSWFGNRCYAALDGSGRVAAGIGTQNTSTIFSAAGRDRRGTDVFICVIWTGSLVTLFEEDKIVYQKTQSGDPAAFPLAIGAAGGGSGTAQLFWNGRIYNALYANCLPTAADVRALRRAWLAGIS